MLLLRFLLKEKLGFLDESGHREGFHISLTSNKKDVPQQWLRETHDPTRACRDGPLCVDENCRFRHAAWHFHIWDGRPTTVEPCPEGSKCKHLTGCRMGHKNEDYHRFQSKQRYMHLPVRYGQVIFYKEELPVYNACPYIAHKYGQASGVERDRHLSAVGNKERIIVEQCQSSCTCQSIRTA